VDALTCDLYQDLCRRARRCLTGEHFLPAPQPAELVHEAYLRLIGLGLTWRSREHFLAMATREMRRILVDRARRRSAVKRRVGGVERMKLSAPRPVRFLDLERALEQLAALDKRMARVVLLHAREGLTYREIADVLAVSAATARLDMNLARTWLRGHLKEADSARP
jgi:RNA polymerase sigma factor (TIGR02999 family)